MLKTWLIFAATLAWATAQTISPVNFTTSTAALKNDNRVEFLVSKSSSRTFTARVLGLTSRARNSIPSGGLSGSVLPTSTSSDVTPLPGNIVLISCNSSPGYLTPAQIFDAAKLADVAAILLYTTEADYCKIEGEQGDYAWIYTMKSAGETNQMLQAVNTAETDSNERIYAAIGYPGSLRNVNGTNGTAGFPPPGGPVKHPLGPSADTAVAMIILYTVTGLITSLFLIIIITGAIRAHRHPERYGPRNREGQARQSRARGLARALLETLPIVKFGERDESKPTDVELASNVTSSGATITERTAAQGTTVENPPSESPQQSDPPRQSVEGGIAAAAIPDQTTKPGNLGCSICTEDFETGQDQRVLPCDHRFHPECVDPWLLNVSGTCPLCRIDLRPASSGTETGVLDENGNPVLREGQFEPPPLGPQGTPGEQHRMTVRRSIMIGLMGIGRPDQMTREERVLALRQLRGQRLARQRREQQAAVATTPEEERSARRTLRDVLRRRAARPADQAAAPGSSTDAEREVVRENARNVSMD